MNTFLNILRDYWGVLIFLIGALIFLITQGRAKASKIILGLMLQAEKNAEAYVLQTGEDKFSFVVSEGYNLLPKIVKAFITPTVFQQLATNLYAAAKGYLTGIEPPKVEQKPPDAPEITE